MDKVKIKINVIIFSFMKRFRIHINQSWLSFFLNGINIIDYSDRYLKKYLFI